jgi:hypothetical protein
MTPARFLGARYRYSDGKTTIKNCGAVQGGSMIGRDARINLLISTGHFHRISTSSACRHCFWCGSVSSTSALPNGLSVVLMTGTGRVADARRILVDRYGARPFLIGGALVMSLAIALMASPRSGKSLPWR